MRDIHYTPSLTLCVRALDESVARPFVHEVRQEPTDSLNCTGVVGSYADFETKVIHVQRKVRKGLLNSRGTGVDAKLNVALVGGPHMLRCLHRRHP